MLPCYSLHCQFEGEAVGAVGAAALALACVNASICA